MHNTKIASSKANEEKYISKKSCDNHPRERAISLMEIYQMMLKYPEVYANILFENIPTIPLELFDGIKRTI